MCQSVVRIYSKLRSQFQMNSQNVFGATIISGKVPFIQYRYWWLTVYTYKYTISGHMTCTHFVHYIHKVVNYFFSFTFSSGTFDPVLINVVFLTEFEIKQKMPWCCALCCAHAEYVRLKCWMVFHCLPAFCNHIYYTLILTVGNLLWNNGIHIRIRMYRIRLFEQLSVFICSVYCIM